MSTTVDAPPVIVQWEEFVNWLFTRTTRFPARLRYTLTARIENAALDVYETLMETRYTRQRAELLRRANLGLDRLRLLLRLTRDQQVLDERAFAHACALIDSTGRMVGGWARAEGR